MSKRCEESKHEEEKGKDINKRSRKSSELQADENLLGQESNLSVMTWVDPTKLKN